MNFCVWDLRSNDKILQAGFNLTIRMTIKNIFVVFHQRWVGLWVVRRGDWFGRLWRGARKIYKHLYFAVLDCLRLFCLIFVRTDACLTGRSLVLPMRASFAGCVAEARHLSVILSICCLIVLLFIWFSWANALSLARGGAHFLISLIQIWLWSHLCSWCFVFLRKAFWRISLLLLLLDYRNRKRSCARRFVALRAILPIIGRRLIRPFIIFHWRLHLFVNLKLCGWLNSLNFLHYDVYLLLNFYFYSVIRLCLYLFVLLLLIYWVDIDCRIGRFVNFDFLRGCCQLDWLLRGWNLVHGAVFLFKDAFAPEKLFMFGFRVCLVLVASLLDLLLMWPSNSGVIHDQWRRLWPITIKVRCHDELGVDERIP